MEYRSIGYESILLPKNKNPYTGRERARSITDNIVLYWDKFGSYRFVMYVNNTAISALQIMVRDYEVPVVANVITIKEFRRKGYARKLWAEAKKMFPVINHSKHLSEDGRAYSTECK